MSPLAGTLRRCGHNRRVSGSLVRTADATGGISHVAGQRGQTGSARFAARCHRISLGLSRTSSVAGLKRNARRVFKAGSAAAPHQASFVSCLEMNASARARWQWATRQTCQRDHALPPAGRSAAIKPIRYHRGMKNRDPEAFPTARRIADRPSIASALSRPAHRPDPRQYATNDQNPGVRRHLSPFTRQDCIVWQRRANSSAVAAQAQFA